MSTRITNVHHTLLLLMLYFSTMHTFTLHFTTLPFTFTWINQHFFFFLALPLNYPHVYPCHFTPHIPANIKNNKKKVEEKRSRHATYFFFSTFTFHNLHKLKPKTKPPTLLPFAINNNKGKKILCLKKVWNINNDGNSQCEYKKTRFHLVPFFFYSFWDEQTQTAVFWLEWKLSGLVKWTPTSFWFFYYFATE